MTEQENKKAPLLVLRLDGSHDEFDPDYDFAATSGLKAKWKLFYVPSIYSYGHGFDGAFPFLGTAYASRGDRMELLSKLMKEIQRERVEHAVLLKGWEKSEFLVSLKAVVRFLGLPVYFEEDGMVSTIDLTKVEQREEE